MLKIMTPSVVIHGTVIGLVLLTLAACQHVPAAGTYTGFTGKMGTAKLRVQSDGTVGEQYGFQGFYGSWTLISDERPEDSDENHAVIIIKGKAKDGAVRYYLLNKATATYEWSYKLDSLRQRAPRNSTQPGPR